VKFIFDLDGVIVHSTPLHVKAWEAYLEPLGIDSASIGRIMLGRHNDDIVRELFGDALPPAEICRHGAAKEAIYREMIRPRVNEHMVPGVRPFLERYAGVDKAVASNAERAKRRLHTARVGPRPVFFAWSSMAIRSAGRSPTRRSTCGPPACLTSLRGVRYF